MHRIYLPKSAPLDLNFVVGSSTCRTLFTVLIDISCPYGRISYGENTLEKVYVDKLVKYGRLARELETIRNMKVEIIPIIASLLGAVYPQSLEELQHLFVYEDKMKKKIERRLSEAAVAGSFQIWRGYAQSMLHSEDSQVNRMAAQEARMAKEEDAVERADGDQGVGSERADDTGEGGEGREGREGREGEDPHDLTDEIDVEM
jgi:hypothetical protein